MKKYSSIVTSLLYVTASLFIAKLILKFCTNVRLRCHRKIYLFRIAVDLEAGHHRHRRRPVLQRLSRQQRNLFRIRYGMNKSPEKLGCLTNKLVEQILNKRTSFFDERGECTEKFIGIDHDCSIVKINFDKMT